MTEGIAPQALRPLPNPLTQFFWDGAMERRLLILQCQNCGHHIFPCAGTVFEKSTTPLTKWFEAMYFMTANRGGISAKELQRRLGVTYKTAWRIRDELRKLMATADYRGALAGQLDTD